MSNIRRRPEPGTQKEQDVNTTGHATESFPSEGTTPASGKPQMGAGEAQLAQVSVLLEAVREYDNAITTAEKTNGKVWEEFTKIARMTKEEGEPVLRELMKRIKADATISESALTSAGQYVSRVRTGWKAGIEPRKGEGANAYYKRARDIIAGKKEQKKEEAPKDAKLTAVENSEDEGALSAEEGREWVQLMGDLRATLQNMSIAELKEVKAWIAARGEEKVVQIREVKAA